MFISIQLCKSGEGSVLSVSCFSLTHFVEHSVVFVVLHCEKRTKCTVHSVKDNSVIPDNFPPHMPDFSQSQCVLYGAMFYVTGLGKEGLEKIEIVMQQTSICSCNLTYRYRH